MLTEMLHGLDVCVDSGVCVNTLATTNKKKWQTAQDQFLLLLGGLAGLPKSVD